MGKGSKGIKQTFEQFFGSGNSYDHFLGCYFDFHVGLFPSFVRFFLKRRIKKMQFLWSHFNIRCFHASLHCLYSLFGNHSTSIQKSHVYHLQNSRSRSRWLQRQKRSIHRSLRTRPNFRWV